MGPTSRHARPDRREISDTAVEVATQALRAHGGWGPDDLPDDALVCCAEAVLAAALPHLTPEPKSASVESAERAALAFLSGRGTLGDYLRARFPLAETGTVYPDGTVGYDLVQFDRTEVIATVRLTPKQAEEFRQAVRPARAEAWDEGHEAFRCPASNPCR